jgi:two-component system, OmpR family, phosphate regulon response regulator PhoB
MVIESSDTPMSENEQITKLSAAALPAPPTWPYVDVMSSGRVLVVDDEPTVREVVASYLVRDGYEVCELDRGDAVMETIERFRPDLVVLDVMLPGASGLELLRDVGPDRIPVILLTARVEEPDRVLGLELGADDYVTKPFSPRELVARVRTVLRRSVPIATETEQLHFDTLSIDSRSRDVSIDGRAVSLTAKEFDLLAFLARSPRQVFSRSQLLHAVWDSSPEYQDPATVTVHVRRLRNKIEVDPENPRWISTVWGVGYRFEP